MIKKVIKYKNFDNEDREKVAYFHIGRARVAEHAETIAEFDALAKGFEGAKREVTPHEITEMIRLVKTIMKMAYGVRSEDGEEFDQRPELWEQFQKTAAYDSFLFSLFQNPQEMYVFMQAVMPGEMREAAMNLVREKNPELLSEIENFMNEKPVETPVAADNRPPWIREDRSPTDEELRNMSPDQLREAFSRQK